MSLISKKHTYYFNSNNSEYYEDKEYNFNFIVDVKEDYTHVCILEMSIPKSFYLISKSTGNTFTLIEKGAESLITVPPGNYNTSNFSVELTILLNAASVVLGNNFTYAITYNDITGKFIYVVSNNDSQPSFRLGDTNIGEQLGLSQIATHAFTDNILNSEYVINFTRERTLYLKSDIINEESDNVLCEIYVNNSDFSQIKYTCPDIEAYSKKINPVKKNIQFSLVNENGKYINLNGQNLVFSLMLYKKDDTHDKQKFFMQFMYDFFRNYSKN